MSQSYKSPDYKEPHEMTVAKSVNNLPQTQTVSDDAFIVVTVGDVSYRARRSAVVSSQASAQNQAQFVEQSFTDAMLVIVNHNFNRFPIVTLFDTSGNVFDAEVANVSVSQCRIIFAAPTSGVVRCS
jgi:hypothetical protein